MKEKLIITYQFVREEQSRGVNLVSVVPLLLVVADE